MSVKSLLSSLGILLCASAAWAHHGWGHYDTARPLIFSARVIEVRWSNPHPELVVQIEAEASMAALPVPHELQVLGFDAVMAAAKPAPPGDWELHLAPINRLQAWGLPRTPRVGDRIEGLGFPACAANARALRPSLVVLDGVGVRQQSVPLPGGCSGRARG